MRYEKIKFIINLNYGKAYYPFKLAKIYIKRQ